MRWLRRTVVEAVLSSFFGVLVCGAVTSSIGADMPKGTVKWFNSQRGMGSFSHRAAAKMCSSTSLQSNEPASAVSMRGKSSNTRKSRIEAKRQLKT